MDCIPDSCNGLILINKLNLVSGNIILLEENYKK